jgi:hypothetical protein
VLHENRVFLVIRWLESDRASIPHRLPRIWQNLITENFQKLIFHDFWISGKVTSSQIASKMVPGDPQWSLDAPGVLLDPPKMKLERNVKT